MLFKSSYCHVYIHIHSRSITFLCCWRRWTPNLLPYECQGQRSPRGTLYCNRIIQSYSLLQSDILMLADWCPYNWLSHNVSWNDALEWLLLIIWSWSFLEEKQCDKIYFRPTLSQLIFWSLSAYSETKNAHTANQELLLPELELPNEDPIQNICKLNLFGHHLQ